MLIRSWYCSIFKELFVLALHGSFGAPALPSVVGRLNYYSTAFRFCQEVFQKKFQFFELFFSLRLLPRPLRENFYILSYSSSIVKGFFENFSIFSFFFTIFRSPTFHRISNLYLICNKQHNKSSSKSSFEKYFLFYAKYT